MMPLGNIVNCATIGNDISAELPLAAQNIGHQFFVRAARLGVRAIVSTHHRVCLSFNDGGAKGGQIRFAQISFIYLCVE